MPLDRALARIAWAGFRSAELFLPPADRLPEPAALSAMLDAASLAVAAVDAGALGGEAEETALESAAHVGRCAVLAHHLQANRVVCDLAIPVEALARPVLDHLRAALAQVPVLLCFRNRPGDGPEARERLLRLVHANPDRLGLALDPGAAYRAGWDPLAEWETLRSSLRHLYATDAAGTAPAALGTGDIPWEALAERVRADDYSGALSLWVQEGMRHADPLFAEADLKEARFLMESWFDGAQ